MPKVLLLNRGEIEAMLSMREAIEEVEKALRQHGEGKVIMPPKLYLNLPEYQGDFRAMPCYVDENVGIKWVSVYPNNQISNLLCVVAIIILCERSTGYPLAIMDGTYITAIRTGAAGGIAVKYLARKDSTIVGMIGGGTQARAQLMAIKEVHPVIKEVKIFDKDKIICKRYAEEMRAKLNLSIRPVKTIEEATEADIVVTTTPSRIPIVKKQYVKRGTHINAIGADAKGKQELEADLLRSASIIVDDIEQASHSGEINVPLSERVIKVQDIWGTLGEVVGKMKEGRKNDEEITIFDSTGLAIQDIVCAKLAYEKAKRIGTGKIYEM